MRVGKIKFDKLNSFTIKGIDYHIYNILVTPTLYLNKYIPNYSYLNIPIVVKIDQLGNCIEINSVKMSVQILRNNSDIEELDCSDKRLKDLAWEDKSKMKRIPIKQLMKEKWGKCFIENILNDLYENNNGNIPYSDFKISKKLNDLEISKVKGGLIHRTYKPIVFIGEILVVSEKSISSSEYNDCLQIIRSERINKIKSRMNLSA